MKKSERENNSEKLNTTDFIFYGTLLFITVVALMLILQIWF